MNRIRIFAGPNGSGKSILYKSLLAQNHFHDCYYVNADELELNLNQNKPYKVPNYFSYSEFNLHLSNTPFKKYGISDQDIDSVILEKSGLVLKDHSICPSYFAAAIADAIRETLLGYNHSFAFETVMSDSSKIDFIKKAMFKGFRVYLYFITTGDSAINLQRIQSRVITGGHSVPEEKINSRYIRSMKNLPLAVPYTARTYLFDNSGENFINIASIIGGRTVNIHVGKIPLWFEDLFPPI